MCSTWGRGGERENRRDLSQKERTFLLQNKRKML